MIRSQKTTFAFAMLCVTCATIAGVVQAQSDELERRASWQMTDDETVARQITEWIAAEEMDAATTEAALKIWESDNEQWQTADRLQRVIHSFQTADPRIAELVARCQSPAAIGDLPDLKILDDPELADVVRDNLRLYLGKWLAISGMYNECVEILNPLTVEQVAAPESLLFYRGIAHYRLRDKENGNTTIKRLLENQDVLPQRYAALAQLMLAELEALEPDSLDEVARIMDSVRVRLALGRAGTRVRKEEDEIIEKLDRKIEELEKKRQQQQQQQQQNNAKGNQSQSPAEDSSLPDGQASPEVDPRRLTSKTEWGDLPPKSREEALQSLGKEFPSHYREVIEEYFRKIAREEVQNTPAP